MAKDEGFAAAQEVVEKLCQQFNSAGTALKNGDNQTAGASLLQLCDLFRELVEACCGSHDSPAVVINILDPRRQYFRIPDASGRAEVLAKTTPKRRNRA
jgi:hypothetical protein